jgi:hypothetical protein
MPNLVFNKVNNTIQQLEVKLIPNEENYKKKKKKFELQSFEGYALFYDENFILKSGLLYKNGKVEAKLSESNKNGKVNDYDVCIDHYDRVCFRDGNGNLVDCSDYQYSFSSGNCFSFSSAGVSSATFIQAINSIALAGSSGGWPTLLERLINMNETTRRIWSNMNQVEKDYFSAKPWLLLKAFAAYKIANDAANEIYCNLGQIDGTNANAYKHAVWAANLYSLVGKHAAMEILDNHEAVLANIPYAEVHRDMDLKNNALGLKTFESAMVYIQTHQFESHTSLFLKIAVGQKINSGLGYVFNETNHQLKPSDNTQHCND